jgi:hypothetical protein
MPTYMLCGIASPMDAWMPAPHLSSMPIDGIAWSWQALEPADLEPLLPFVMAADPSGTEALYWKRDAAAWLEARPTPRGIVSVKCLAGLTLALFFYALPKSPAGLRRFAVERLRWLELARPHRSLDALLTIIVESGRQLDCDEVSILSHAATERSAKAALDERAEHAGFSTATAGWLQRL